MQLKVLLLAVVFSACVMLAVHAAPLTVGNLLVGVRSSAYVPTIHEVQPNGTIVQSWTLSCYQGNTFTLVFSTDNYIAAMVCETDSTNTKDKFVYMLNSNGELTSKRLKGPFLGLGARAAVVEGNDVWVGGLTKINNINTAALEYTTLDSDGTVTEIATDIQSSNLNRLEIFENKFYLAFTRNDYSVARVATAPKPPQTTLLKADMTLPFDSTAQLASGTDGFYIYSNSDYYISGYDPVNKKFITRAYNDGTSWKYYTKTSPNANDECYGIAAMDIDGSRKVFVAATHLYVIDDSLTAFGASYTKILAGGTGYITAVSVIKQGPTCSDNIKNQDETDLDCGGHCGATCAVDASCKIAGDCVSGVCTNNQCAPPSCSDTVKNQGETDVDCGGPNCPACKDDFTCKLDSDCANLFCNSSMICATPTCSDMTKNQDETDVDCGGAICSKCQDDFTCKVDSDCTNLFCNSSMICATPTCSDSAKNQAETDVDCGGSICDKCSLDKSCKGNTDCQSNLCSNSLCAEPTPVPDMTPESNTPSDATPSSSTPSDTTPVSNTPTKSTPFNGPQIRVSGGSRFVFELMLVVVLCLLASI